MLTGQNAFCYKIHKDLLFNQELINEKKTKNSAQPLSILKYTTNVNSQRRGKKAHYIDHYIAECLNLV